MTTSDPENAVIEAAKALVARLKKDGEWATDGYGDRDCIVCGSHENGIHDSDCELAALMSAVDDMKRNPAVYTMPKITIPSERPPPREGGELY